MDSTTATNEKTENNVEAGLSNERQEKLLRLLGGKKKTNASAATDWINKSRSVEEEKSLQKGLEAQYTSSMNHRISGKARRHEGIGFEQQEPDKHQIEKVAVMENQGQEQICSNKTGSPSSSPTRRRSRSRSPLRNEKQDMQKESTAICPGHSEPSAGDVTTKSVKTDVTHKSIDKKNFYMQFTKAKDSS